MEYILRRSGGGERKSLMLNGESFFDCQTTWYRDVVDSVVQRSIVC
jgi:hypothetical protein